MQKCKSHFQMPKSPSQKCKNANRTFQISKSPSKKCKHANRIFSLPCHKKRIFQSHFFRFFFAILIHIQGNNLSQDWPFQDYVPSPEEHFLRQDPGEQGRMFRPRLMIHITDDEWSLDILMKLRDLGRCVLAGRAVCRDHVLYNAVDFHNVSTHYLSIVVLNLGNIIRPPWFANRKRFPSEIRNNEERLRENLILPYLVVNNPGHIVTLNES